MHPWVKVGSAIPTISFVAFWIVFVWLAPVREHPWLLAAVATSVVGWAVSKTLVWNARGVIWWHAKAVASTEGGAVICAHQLAALLGHNKRYWYRLHGVWRGEWSVEDTEVVVPGGEDLADPCVAVCTERNVQLLFPPFVLLDVGSDTMRVQVGNCLTLITDVGAESCLERCHGGGRIATEPVR